MRQSLSVFKDESRLYMNYVPPRLQHRETHLALLHHFFRRIIDNPGKTSQHVLISGGLGTGKTVISRYFGSKITEVAQERGINLRYVHVNCRERKGSLFLVLQRAISKFYSRFPKRGYSSDEILQLLMQTLDEKNAFLILALDEVEQLIRNQGSTPLYKLTRIQEGRSKARKRVSLIYILRRPEFLDALEPRIRSVLKNNVVSLKEYSESQIQSIIRDRANLAFRSGAVSQRIIELIADLSVSDSVDARSAIDLLWRTGKCADASGSSRVLPEHVRKAEASGYHTLRNDVLAYLSLHEKLFLLGVARRFKRGEAAHISMGEAEDSYSNVCEEHRSKRRSHTQLWKYVRNLLDLGVIKTRPSGVGRRGKTTLISLINFPVSELEQKINRSLRAETGQSGTVCPTEESEAR